MRQWSVQDCPSIAWKNGGGVTTELIVYPDGSTLDDFEWRISTAQVRANGPFSIFPGVDRSLCVLQGRGMSLHVAGEYVVHLDEHSRPFRFDGAQAIQAELIDNVLDLNVMSRRGVWSHHLRRVANGAQFRSQFNYEAAVDIAVLYCDHGKATFSGVDGSLTQGDVMMMENMQRDWTVHTSSGSVVYVIELRKIT